MTLKVQGTCFTNHMTLEIVYIWLKIMVILFGIGIYFMRVYYHIWETRMCLCL